MAPPDDANKQYYSAVKRGSIDRVRELFSHEPIPDIDHVSPAAKGKTALFAARENGLVDIVEYLLDRGARTRPTEPGRDTAMHRACLVRNEDDRLAIWRLLLTKDPALINVKGFSGSACLIISAAAGHEKSVEWLLNNGADANVRDKDEKTAWDYANDDVEAKRDSVFELFVNKQSDHSMNNSDPITKDPTIGECGACHV